MTTSKRWLRVAAAFGATFAFALLVFFAVPLVIGMVRSGGATAEDVVRVAGLDVFTVTLDGSGGFATTYGPGAIVLPVALGLLVGAAAAVTAVRARSEASVARRD